MKLNKLFLGNIIGAGLVLSTALWLNSGTLATYAITSSGAMTDECGYLISQDHDHLVAPSRLFLGEPRANWESSVVLRRILFALLSLPLIKAFGLVGGGFFSAMILSLGTLVWGGLWVRRLWGEESGRWYLWLMALFPGFVYWGTLPYCYLMIIPSSLIFAMAFHYLEKATKPSEVVRVAILLGILNLGYDLLPIFGLGALTILILKKRYRWIPGFIFLAALPSVLWMIVLQNGLHVPLANSNTGVYGNILGSFFSDINFSNWADLLLDSPSVLIENFLDSGFLFLPLSFALVLIMALLSKLKLALSLPEKALLIGASILFLINNLAPPYPGWQMRGVWIARLYMPCFIAYVIYLCRVLPQLRTKLVLSRRRTLEVIMILTLIGNLILMFGIPAELTFASEIFHRFYRHGPPEMAIAAREARGLRPFGFCLSIKPQKTIFPPNAIYLPGEI